MTTMRKALGALTAAAGLLFALVSAMPTASAATTVAYQAESATISQGVVASNHTGYTGTGFVDYTNITGSYVQFAVTAASAGPGQLAFRFANGTAVDRPMDITVNGTKVATGVSFPATADWNSWQTVTVNAALTAGANTVRATATTANGGPNLDELSVTPVTDTTAPSTPGAPSCTGITATGLTLDWGASTDNVGVTAYDIYEHGNKLSQAAGNVTSAALTGLTPATGYTLSVDARDAAGNVSVGSSTVVCTTLPSSDTTPPTAPTGLAVSGVAANSATLRWAASTDNVGVTAYDVRGGSTVFQSVTGTPPATTATLTGLACNTAYDMNVVARDAGDNTSAQSNTVDFTTAACSTDGGVPSSVTTVSTGWTVPWGISWLPDNQTALVTERDSFKLYKLTLGGVRTLIGPVPNVVTTGGEGGLLGVAVDPNWGSNHYIYLFHTAAEGNRIARMTYNGSTLTGYTILLQGIAKNKYHNGGRMAFGPDGYLYATTGDAETSSYAQDKNSLNGKILRLTTAGKPAPGNPFGNYVYSYGHRNGQGLAFDASGRLWEAELGNSAYDELNLIKPGADYGWPTCEGMCSTAGMTNPKAVWPVNTASPSGIAIVRNVVYMAALRGTRLWRIPINGTSESVGTPTAYYVGTYGRLRTVVKIPGADQLWLSTTNCDLNGGAAAGSDKIFRVVIS
jgi:glucose/arabinose dehydrogenase